ncbi:MAG: DUF1284 domain-containing protein [Deltaproteobacteria bacterium]|nr:DUF1284 domain-containing protein [Deltaproteobacteria bacterium]MDP3030228.1 DUF1284 domain-containing protein [Deltaproteobacteria bacterium]
MPVLRGHHLICLYFFAGEGYAAEFIENLRSTLNAAKSEPIEICAGADDICGKCPYLKDGLCRYNKNAEEEIKKMDNAALRLLKLTPGTQIKWSGIEERLPEIFFEWHKSYCGDCDWKIACEKKKLFQVLKSNQFQRA